jgi:hypothetical protein
MRVLPPKFCTSLVRRVRHAIRVCWMVDDRRWTMLLSSIVHRRKPERFCNSLHLDRHSFDQLEVRLSRQDPRDPKAGRIEQCVKFRLGALATAEEQ